MKLLIDLDSVTADFWEHLLNYHNNKFNENLTIDDIYTYDLLSNIKSEYHNDITLFMNGADFFYNLPVIADSVTVTQSLLKKGHKILFVTATPAASPTAYFDKIRWVDKWFPHIGKRKLISAYEKFEVKGDLLFDDSPYNIVDFGGITVAMDYKYNRKIVPSFRVNTWNEFEKIVDLVSSIDYINNESGK